MSETEVNPFYADLYPAGETLTSKQEVAPEKPIIMAGRGGAFKTTPSQQTEMLKAMGRGTAKGVLGGLGDVEYSASTTLPRALGFKVDDGTMPFGRSTIFPTSEEVGTVIEKIGLGKTPEKYQPIENISEFAAGFYGGKKTADVAEGVKETGIALSPKSAISRVFGSDKTVSEVGESISTKLYDRLTKLIDARRAEAKPIFQKYFDSAKPFEDQIRNDYTQAMGRFQTMFKDDLSKEEANIIADSVSRLSGEKGIGALEKERRRLFEVADGVYEGYGAIAKQRAGQMANFLQETIEKTLQRETGSNPARAAFDFYSEASKPINDFARATGGKVTVRAGEFLPDVPKIAEAKLPPAFFENARSVEDLKNLSGDPNFATEKAREYIASQFAESRLKTADQVDAFMAKNRDWLKGVPEVIKDLETLKSRLGRAEVTKTVGKVGALGGATLGGTLGGLSLYDIIRGR
jgi:hypothetical protein